VWPRLDRGGGCPCCDCYYDRPPFTGRRTGQVDTDRVFAVPLHRPPVAYGPASRTAPAFSVAPWWNFSRRRASTTTPSRQHEIKDAARKQRAPGLAFPKPLTSFVAGARNHEGSLGAPDDAQAGCSVPMRALHRLRAQKQVYIGWVRLARPHRITSTRLSAPDAAQ